jgi:2-oxoisovalerate dehydrogenase E1 component
MLRTCVELAEKERRVIIYIEPIALYLTRDLHQEGDGLWLSAYESPLDEHLPVEFGQMGITGEGTDLCILTYGNGFYLSCQAMPGLEEAGISLRIVDLRWLAPLNEDEIVAQVSKCKAVLIVDECRKTGSISEALMTLMMERQVCAPLSRVTAKDSFIPIGLASTLTLPDVEQITQAALRLLEHRQA